MIQNTYLVEYILQNMHVMESTLKRDGAEEGEDGPELIGHAWFQAPDCDGAVHIQSGEAAVGDIVTVDLVDSFCYEMVGMIVEEA